MNEAALTTAPKSVVKAIAAIVCICYVSRFLFSEGACVWRPCSHVRGQYLLVLEILLQGDAASHDGREFDVVHGIGAGVFGQVFLDDLAPNPANSSDKAGDGCGVHERFHELVVGHGGVYLVFLVSNLVFVLSYCVIVILYSLAKCPKEGKVDIQPRICQSSPTEKAYQIL